MNKFKAFWFARTLSYYGDYIFSITLVWFALVQGGAWGVAGAVSLSIIARAVGSFILAPWVNYIGSRKMIVWSDLVRGGLMVLFWFVAMGEGSNLTYVTLLLTAGNSFLAGGFEAAMQSYIPTISEQLRKANADLASGRSITQLVGFLTGGALMQWFFGAGFMVNAVTFIIAGIVSFFIGGGAPTLSAKGDQRSVKEVFSRFSENWQAARKAITDSSTLRLVFWTSLTINTFLVPMLVMMAPLVRDVIGGGSFLLSVVNSATVVGGLGGAMLMRRLDLKWRDSHVLIVGALLCGAVGILASFSHWWLMLILVMAVFGLGQVVYNISESTIIQQSEPHLRSSIYAVVQMVSVICYPLATFAAAQLESMISLRAPFAIGGSIVLVMTALFAWRWLKEQRALEKLANAAAQATTPSETTQQA
ncbi:MFS transporter [Tumebacillus sp. DT12]|uniref:MFS transporter n=1 Tax=Tumebacillus lacus TaxID=2995335 RepID=A0ABT3X107_9BACL|nr:MFS transporter [Tumebacillus lacus]MCX7569452.1 MFS transporter [Tumebacillus lacus]